MKVKKISKTIVSINDQIYIAIESNDKQNCLNGSCAFNKKYELCDSVRCNHQIWKKHIGGI